MTADEPLISTGTLSQSPGQFKSLWALREGITECLQKEGKPYKYDISVPIADFEKVVDIIRERIVSKGLYGEHAVTKVVGFGHVGDGGGVKKEVEPWLIKIPTGNLHLNVVAKHGYKPEIEAALEPFLYETVGAWTSCVRSTGS